MLPLSGLVAVESTGVGRLGQAEAQLTRLRVGQLAA